MQSWQYQDRAGETRAVAEQELAKMVTSGQLPLNALVRHPKRTNDRWVEAHWVASRQEYHRLSCESLDSNRQSVQRSRASNIPCRKSYSESLRDKFFLAICKSDVEHYSGGSWHHTALCVVFLLASVLFLGWVMDGVDRMMPDALDLESVSEASNRSAEASGHEDVEDIESSALQRDQEASSENRMYLNAELEPQHEIVFVTIRGRRLRSLLAERDLLPREVAQRANVPVDVIQRMLWKESASVSSATADSLARALQTSADLLQ